MKARRWGTGIMLILFSVLSCNVRAEYYLTYSAPECAACDAPPTRVVTHHHYHRHYKSITSCNKKVYPKRHHYSSKPRSHYHISVYYYNYSFVPPCACEYGCMSVQYTCCTQANSSYQKRSRTYVGFSGEPTSYRGARLYTNEETEPSYYQDRSTADDDANSYPDMNIDN